MLELAVAALRRDETPTVVVQHPQYLADFHHASISGPNSFGRPAPLGRHNAHAQRPEREQRERPVRCNVMLGSATSLNDLIRPRQHRGWNREAEGFRGLEVDNQLERCRLLDGKIGGFDALQDAVDVGGQPPASRCAAMARARW
jgi:hypothetical protein